MKQILKHIPCIIIAVISFTVITIMDLVWLLMALCIKATRLIFTWLMSAFYLDRDTNEIFNWIAASVNFMTNVEYKFYIDWMYPVEEDSEDEDEDDSLYDDDED